MRISRNCNPIGTVRVQTSRWSAFPDWTMIKVSKIEWLGGHRLEFVFTDGCTGDFDFSALVAESDPIVEPLRHPDYFRRVFLDYGAPTWPNGSDLAPAWLRSEIEKTGRLSRPTLV